MAKAFGPNEVLKVSGVWFWKMESLSTTAKLNIASTLPIALACLSISSQPDSVVMSWVEIWTSAPYEAQALLKLEYEMENYTSHHQFKDEILDSFSIRVMGKQTLH